MPWVRWNSAVLIRMSTLPPITPARSRTDLLVGHVERHDARPAASLPAHRGPAPASTARRCRPRRCRRRPRPEPCASACPTALLPSVIRTLRNFGSLVISRSIGSSAMFVVSCGGQRDQHRLPALVEMRAHAHARRRGRAIAVQVRQQARPGVEPHQCQAATARARDSKARSSDAARFRRSVRPRRRSRAIRAGATGTSRRPRAADTAPCRNRGSVCSSKRPSAAAAVRRSAARLRAAGGRVGRRSARTGLRGFGAVDRLGHARPRTAAPLHRPRS